MENRLLTRYAAIADEIQGLPDTAEVLYFAGCDNALRQPEIGKGGAEKVFRAAGVDHTMIKAGEPCCGEPLRLMGYIDDFKASARKGGGKHCTDRGEDRGCATCPSCLRMMKEVYCRLRRRSACGVEFFAHVRIRAAVDDSGQLKFNHSLDLKTTFHDSVTWDDGWKYLNRPAGMASLPGVQFQDMFFNRRDAAAAARRRTGSHNLELVIEASNTVVDSGA